MNKTIEQGLALEDDIEKDSAASSWRLADWLLETFGPPIHGHGSKVSTAGSTRLSLKAYAEHSRYSYSHLAAWRKAAHELSPTDRLEGVGPSGQLDEKYGRTDHKKKETKKAEKKAEEEEPEPEEEDEEEDEEEPDEDEEDQDDPDESEEDQDEEEDEEEDKSDPNWKPPKDSWEDSLGKITERYIRIEKEILDLEDEARRQALKVLRAQRQYLDTVIRRLSK